MEVDPVVPDALARGWTLMEDGSQSRRPHVFGGSIAVASFVVAMATRILERKLCYAGTLPDRCKHGSNLACRGTDPHAINLGFVTSPSTHLKNKAPRLNIQAGRFV